MNRGIVWSLLGVLIVVGVRQVIKQWHRPQVERVSSGRMEDLFPLGTPGGRVVSDGRETLERLQVEHCGGDALTRDPEMNDFCNMNFRKKTDTLSPVRSFGGALKD